MRLGMKKYHVTTDIGNRNHGTMVLGGQEALSPEPHYLAPHSSMALIVLFVFCSQLTILVRSISSYSPSVKSVLAPPTKKPILNCVFTEQFITLGSAGMQDHGA